jgi:hypothetical protein
MVSAFTQAPPTGFLVFRFARPSQPVDLSQPHADAARRKPVPTPERGRLAGRRVFSSV